MPTPPTSWTREAAESWPTWRVHEQVLGSLLLQVGAGFLVVRVLRGEVGDHDTGVEGDHSGQSSRSSARCVGLKTSSYLPLNPGISL
jgi:hypothetical protein